MYRNIVLAYDGTREGRAVLREGAELAQRCGAAVHLLAVVHPSTGILFAEAAEPSDLIDAQTQHVEQILAEGADKLRDRGLNTQATLRQGDPAEAILALASAVEADLIVIGNHRRNALSRWWRGCVHDEILAQAPCSLLIAVGAAVPDGA